MINARILRLPLERLDELTRQQYTCEVTSGGVL